MLVQCFGKDSHVNGLRVGLVVEGGEDVASRLHGRVLTVDRLSPGLAGLEVALGEGQVRAGHRALRPRRLVVTVEADDDRLLLGSDGLDRGPGVDARLGRVLDNDALGHVPVAVAAGAVVGEVGAVEGGREAHFNSPS